MTDSWTILAADSDTITVQVNIEDVSHSWVLGSSDIDASNEIDLLTSLRDFVTRQRDAVLSVRTPPLVVSNLVGHTEEF